ncbi:MAG: ATP-grasp domain-containing protein [Polaromonas sp.]
MTEFDCPTDADALALRSVGHDDAAKTVLLVCPTMWDEAEIPRIVNAGGYRVLMCCADVNEAPASFDALHFIDGAVALITRHHVDGVMASDDYPGSILAAAIASHVGLPGPNPATVLLCQHKCYSRVAQREVVPEAVPAFWLLDQNSLAGETPWFRFPLFVKPVKSFFSVLARRVENIDQLRSLTLQAREHLREFVKPFNHLLERYTQFRIDDGHLLGEEPLRGNQVTVEGYIFKGEGRIIGITDSVMHPGTISFKRFEYPSAMSADAQARMAELALRFMQSIDFDNGLFNIEMFHDPVSDDIKFIEVNPRMCAQFADLMEKVNGVNTYEIALSIAAGIRPVVRREVATHAAATSFVLRAFENRRVTRVPTEEELAALTSRWPDARVKVLCREGHLLSDELQDGNSYRYAVVNLGGANRVDLLEEFDQILRHLRFDFEPASCMPSSANAAGAEHMAILV